MLVKRERMSPLIRFHQMPECQLATEDRNFYHEPGFSVTGMIRGGLTTVWYRIRGINASAGGSTITQQLVKNAFLTQKPNHHT